MVQVAALKVSGRRAQRMSGNSNLEGEVLLWVKLFKGLGFHMCVADSATESLQSLYVCSESDISRGSRYGADGGGRPPSGTMVGIW